MDDTTQLSPWAHPKAQQWFETLLERSGFIEEIEEQIVKEDDFLELPAARLMIALLVLLGRPGIWPERHRRALARAVSKVKRIAGKQANPDSAKNGGRRPLTLDEHRRTSVAANAIEEELEIVRRWAAMSNRRTPIRPPATWDDFWG